MRNFGHLTAVVFLLLALSACSAQPHRAVPEQLAAQAAVRGFPADIRYAGDEAPDNLAFIINRRIGQYKATYDAEFRRNGKYPPMTYLALSGGGNDGAFGAGLLHGWSAAGTRPEFTIVTGTSTGALIAPFAFLGTAHDADLKKFYTTLNSSNIFLHSVSTIFDGLTGGMALTDNAPLASMIERTVTPDMFAQIGAEHRKGRRLLIGTTNLETQRSVIWDIGKIANSGVPDGLSLFHNIMLASAAIPGAFKPVFINVTVGGKNYNEIHVDGGVTAQVFLYPLQSVVDEKKIFAEHGIERELYIIRNAKISPEYQRIKPRLVSLSQRSIETLIKNQSIGDLFKLYAASMRDGIGYNLVYMPQEFKAVSKELFDPEYMSQLFALGDKIGKDGIEWLHMPPHFALVQQQGPQKPARPWQP